MSGALDSSVALKGLQRNLSTLNLADLFVCMHHTVSVGAFASTRPCTPAPFACFALL